MKKIVGFISLILLMGCSSFNAEFSGASERTICLKKDECIIVRIPKASCMEEWRIVASREYASTTVTLLQGKLPVYGILIESNLTTVVEENEAGSGRRVISKRCGGTGE